MKRLETSQFFGILSVIVRFFSHILSQSSFHSPTCSPGIAVCLAWVDAYPFNTNETYLPYCSTDVYTKKKREMQTKTNSSRHTFLSVNVVATVAVILLYRSQFYALVSVGIL